MNRKILLFLLFNILFFQPAPCQSITNVAEMAEYYQKNENFPLAIKEYQRYLFFSQNANPEILYKIGQCFYRLEQYEKAGEFFDKAFFSFGCDSLKLDALFEKCECLILNRDYSLALNELFGISDSITENNYYKREFYIAVSYFGIEDFNNAEKSFINAIDPQKASERAKISLIFKNKRRLYQPNPNTASIMSMCLPGLGQFYAGDIKNGFNSIILLSALTYVTVQIGINQSVLDALVTMGPWYQRYYQGGFARAEKIAIEKRSDNRRKAYEEIIQNIADTKN